MVVGFTFATKALALPTTVASSIAILFFQDSAYPLNQLWIVRPSTRDRGRGDRRKHLVAERLIREHVRYKGRVGVRMLGEVVQHIRLTSAWLQPPDHLQKHLFGRRLLVATFQAMDIGVIHGRKL